MVTSVARYAQSTRAERHRGGRDRAERPRIVIEANRIVEPGGFSRHIAVAPHALGTVVEPPGRPELERRIDARHRRQFAPVAGFVQREDYQGEPGVMPGHIQKRAKCFDVIGSTGNIEPLVDAVLVKDRARMVAARARVDLHHQPVLEAHLSHLS